jgi:hypothetical protein
MAKNLGRKYATMTEDERRQFALEEEEGTRELPAELAFDEPRNEDRMGQHYPNAREEVADPEHRDGLSAQLDDEQHQRAVREQATRGECVEDEASTESRMDDV